MRITQGKWFWLGVLLFVAFQANSQNSVLRDSIHASESSASMSLDVSNMSMDENTMFVFAEKQLENEWRRIVLVHQKQTNGKWMVIQELTSSSGSFGAHLDMHGNYAVISGADSGFYIFEQDEQGVWKEVQLLNGYSGEVAIYEETIVIADSLHVYSRKQNGIWERAEVSIPEGISFVGYTLADVYQNTMIAVGREDDGRRNYIVYVFKRHYDGVWRVETELFHPITFNNYAIPNNLSIYKNTIAISFGGIEYSWMRIYERKYELGDSQWNFTGFFSNQYPTNHIGIVKDIEVHDDMVLFTTIFEVNFRNDYKFYRVIRKDKDSGEWGLSSPFVSLIIKSTDEKASVSTNGGEILYAHNGEFKNDGTDYKGLIYIYQNNPTISSSVPNITNRKKIPIKIDFHQPVNGFSDTDLILENATVEDLSTSDGILFFANLIPDDTIQSKATLYVSFPDNIAIYSEGNTPNESSNVFSVDYWKTSNTITGRVYEDVNKNGTFEIDTDRSLHDNLVISTVDDIQQTYSYTQQDGSYELLVGTGDYTIQVATDLHEGLLISSETITRKVYLDSFGSSIDSLDFPLQITKCPILSVDVSSNRRRRCFENQTVLTYQNTGFADSEEAKVYLKLPEYADLVRADSSFTLTEDSVYVFDVGVLKPGDFGTINITDIVRCESGITGLDQCTEAWITPANTCLVSNDSSITDWDKSNLEIEGYCASKTEGIRFVIKNTGEGDMADSSTYRIYENADLANSNRFKLAKGDSLVIQTKPFLGALRLDADQTMGNPNSSLPNATVTGCANGVAYRISTANFFEQDDASLQIEVDCLPIINSFDPNDKMATPQGITENRYVKPDTRLEYRIRFQNTGTDTAYTVVVVDTLSPLMDISTFRMGSTSHNYDLQVSGEGSPVLTWTFNDIDLPDSTENEPESYGFIKFGIAPFAGYPDGTIVRNEANIYFDFNEPILTNNAWVNYYDTVLVTPSYQFGADLDLPIPTFVGLEEYTNKPFMAEVNINENAILEIQDLTLSNATASELQGTEKSYTMLISPIADGEVSIQISEKSFADLAGNGNLQSNEIKTIYDATLPVLNWIYSEESPFEVVFEPSEITTGTISLSDLEIVGATPKSLTEEGGKYTLALEPIVGSLSVKLKSGVITDRAGNGNEEIEKSFIITSKSDETLSAYTSLSPNPNNGRFRVDFPWAVQGNKTIQVIDMLGRTILEKKTNEISTEIDLKNQESGSYILRIIADSGIATKLFVKQ